MGEVPHDVSSLDGRAAMIALPWGGKVLGEALEECSCACLEGVQPCGCVEHERSKSNHRRASLAVCTSLSCRLFIDFLLYMPLL